MRIRRFVLTCALAVLTACGSDSPSSTRDESDATSRSTSSTATSTRSTTTAVAAETTTSATSPTSTIATASPATTTTFPFDRAFGAGTVRLDGEARNVEVLACGWLETGGSDEPLRSEPTSRGVFRLTVMEQVDDAAFIVDLDRDDQVGIISVNVLQVAVGSAGTDDPRNLWWGNDRQTFSVVDVDGGAVTTSGSLTVLEDPSSSSSPSHELGIDVTCTEFGGIPDEFAQVVATVAGVELPQFGAAGVVSIDGTDYPVETVSCTIATDIEAVAESTRDDLVVSAVDFGPDMAGIFSDTVGIDIDNRSLVADVDVDIVIDDTMLRTAEPVQLYDLFTREPAGQATVAIDCG